MNSTISTNASGNFQLPFKTTEGVTAVSIVMTLCALGTITNIIAITVIATSSLVKTTFYLLILSLSVSDLVSALISPLAVYRITWGFSYWNWPRFLCTAYWGSDIWTSYVTASHILMFSVFRFISIQWPHLYTAFTLKRTKISICVVWMITCACGFVPLLFWFDVNQWMRGSGLPGSNFPSCTLTPTSFQRVQLYTKIAYPIFFYFPLLLVIAFSFGIFLKVYLMRKKRKELKGHSTRQDDDTSEAKRRRKERYILLQLGLIVGSFVVGYIPRTAYHFVNLGSSFPPEELWRFSISEYLALRASESFNPVFYVVSSSKMRKETIQLLKSVWKSLMPCKKNKSSTTQRTIITTGLSNV